MEAHRITLRSTARAARVEIIPLIDVIFFLLATFVLFTLSLNRTQTLELNLPYPGGEPSISPPVNIQVSNDGALYWDQEATTLSELPVRLSSYKAQERNPRIMVSGDEQARFGSTVLVLDELRKAGIQKFSVETKIRATGK